MTGCAKTSKPGSKEGRFGQSISLAVTEAPENSETLEEGAFLYDVTLVSEAGLHPDTPVVLTVTDSDGLVSVLDLKEYIDATSGSLTGTSIDWETGRFVIDGEDDLYLDAGTKTLELVVMTASNDTLRLTSSNEVTPWLSPTGTEYNQARADWTGRLAEITTEYGNLLNELSFESPASDWVDLDRGLMAAVNEHILNRAMHPSPEAWPSSATDLEDSVSELYGASPTNDVTELAFRESYERLVGWERYWCERWRSIADFVQLRGRFQVPDNDKRLARHAYHQHAFTQVDITEDEGVTTFDARIYLDEGTPVECTGWPEAFDPETVEANSADPENPAWHLVVTFTDSDADGEVDSVEASGAQIDPDTDIEADFGTIDLNGHLITALQPLFESCYYQGMGG